MTKFQQKVYNKTRQIPQGNVSTYQDIARALCRPRAARAVGNALNKNPFREVPCHRVVRANGSIGGYARGTKEKIKLLRKEGVKIVNEKVDNVNILKVI